MSIAILDTDTLSELFRGNTKVAKKVNVYVSDYGSVNISIITYYEIVNGLLYKDAKKQMEGFLQFTSKNNIIPLTIRSTTVSAEIQANLRKKGLEIGHTDTLIAGIAIANNFVLVTNNTSHFKRIEDLVIANWTK